MIKTMTKMMPMILMIIAIKMKIHDGEKLKCYILFFFILKFIDFTSQINANKQLIGIHNAGKPALEK